jgi:hypothetical protein
MSKSRRKRSHEPGQRSDPDQTESHIIKCQTIARSSAVARLDTSPGLPVTGCNQKSSAPPSFVPLFPRRSAIVFCALPLPKKTSPAIAGEMPNLEGEPVFHPLFAPVPKMTGPEAGQSPQP